MPTAEDVRGTLDNRKTAKRKDRSEGVAVRIYRMLYNRKPKQIISEVQNDYGNLY